MSVLDEIDRRMKRHGRKTQGMIFRKTLTISRMSYLLEDVLDEAREHLSQKTREKIERFVRHHKRQGTLASKRADRNIANLRAARPRVP